MNILIPLINPKYINNIPYPLKIVKDKMIFEWFFKSILVPDNCTFYIITHQKEESRFKLGYIIKNKLNLLFKESESQLIIINKNTNSCPETCDQVNNNILNANLKTIIMYPNIYFEPIINLNLINDDFFIFTIKSNNPEYSYALLSDDNHYLKNVKEKIIISKYSIIGIYGFKDFHIFKKYNYNLINKNIKYLSEIYNEVTKTYKVKNNFTELIYYFSNNIDCLFFENKLIFDYFNKPISLACDHSGYNTKIKFMKILDKCNINYIDFGTYTEKDCDYNEYINEACNSIINKKSHIGFGFCKTGQGVNICANKHNNIISALIYSKHSLKMTINHNGTNFFCFPENINENTIYDYIEILKTNKFLGGRFQTRINKLK